MAAEIRNLSPQHVWGYFHDLTQIPRPTGHMDAVTRYILAFGKESGLETLQDKTGNIVIRKPATPGMEHCKTVIIQGHLDMVGEKRPNVEHDFTKDGLNISVKDGYVTANGTTLGGDDGIAVAYGAWIQRLARLDAPVAGGHARRGAVGATPFQVACSSGIAPRTSRHGASPQAGHAGASASSARGATGCAGSLTFGTWVETAGRDKFEGHVSSGVCDVQTCTCLPNHRVGGRPCRRCR